MRKKTLGSFAGDRGGLSNLEGPVLPRWLKHLDGGAQVSGSSSIQSACAFWMWRRHFTVSHGGLWGWWYGRMVYQTPWHRLFSPLDTGSKSDSFSKKGMDSKRGCQGSTLLVVLSIGSMDRISRQSPSVLGGQFWWPQDWVSAFSWSVGQNLSTESELAGLTTSISKSKTMVLNWEMVAWSLQAREKILPQLQKITRGLVHEWGKNLLGGGHEYGCFVSSDAAV